MNKLSMHTLSLANRNFSLLSGLFPNAITEAIDEDGNVVRAIDADVLAQEINTRVVSGKEERYQFTWPDKKKSILLANAPIAKTLRPCREESVDFDNTENLYIEGDNLEVLKLLQETYLGKIKMIYIDPPYNTGNDFVYEDDFAQSTSEYLSNSGQFDEEGNRLVQNTESNGRFHTDWLNMMYPRLKLAKDLLSDEGVIFISIDDNELKNMLNVCNEIFGEHNFIAQIAVQLNPRGRNLDRYIAKTHEYVIVYSKNYTNGNSMYGIDKEGSMVEEYNKQDKIGKYRQIGLRNRNQSFNPVTRPNLYYPLYVNPTNKAVSIVQNSEYVDEVWPDTPDGIKTCWTWAKAKVQKENNLIEADKSGNEWRIFRKDYLLDDTGNVATTLIKSFWSDKEINNDYGKKAIKELFGSAIMDFPKSPDLIKKLVAPATRGKGIVMDFFSGSATTAQAVMELNIENGYDLKYIMVQLQEVCDEKSEAYNAGFTNICEIGKERIRRAGDKIREKAGLTVQNLDTGFRVLKVDSSNMKDVYYNPENYTATLFDSITDNIKEDRTHLDLLFQVMLEMDVLLSKKIVETEIAGKKVFSVMDDYMIACFDKGITSEVVEAIAKKQPYYAVFRDSCMADDSTMASFEQIFETYSKDTIRKVL